MRFTLEGVVMKAEASSRVYDGQTRHRVMLTVFDGEETVRVSCPAVSAEAAAERAKGYKVFGKVSMRVKVSLYQGRLGVGEVTEAAAS